MFHQPKTLESALELRASLGTDATVINGGTDVVVAMNHGGKRPRRFLDLSHVDELRSVQRQNGSILIGGGVTFAQLGQLPIRCLREASLSVGGPAIRNMGTIGGNLVTASPAGDGSVALLALGADVELSSSTRGSRWVAVQDFFVDYRKTLLAEDELATRVRIPARPLSRWYKIGKRGAVNISLVCCAVARRPDGQYGIAFGCVGPMPMIAPKAQQLVGAGPLSPDVIEAASDLASSETKPIDDFRGSAAYRRAMCRTLSRRLLTELANASEASDSDA